MRTEPEQHKPEIVDLREQRRGDSNNEGDRPPPIHAEVLGGPGRSHTASVSDGTDLGALVALALAVLSWIILPIIGAIAALLIAPGAKRRIRESNGRLNGENLASAAQAIAVLNIVTVTIVAWGVVSLFRRIF
jgi:hypothetical protein